MECLNEDVYMKKEKKKNDTFCTSLVGTIKSLLAPDGSASSTPIQVLWIQWRSYRDH